MRPEARALLENLRRVIVGKDDALRLAITCLLARGHLLIEDVPGVGKTMLARALARSVRSTMRRIQFTPDLLPTDVTGVAVYHPSRQDFEFHPGPVFTHILLADEINRASPRTQSSLLECMEESQVTVDGKTHALERLFFVMATQNPIELEGTYALPEAQLDRFLMLLEIGYPDAEEECRILSGQVRSHPIDELEPVLEVAEVVALQEQVRAVHVAEELRRYMVEIVQATRAHPDVRLGVSPRGSLALQRAAQAHAFAQGLGFVTPDAVKAVAPAVLAHRLILDPQREAGALSRRSLVERLIAKIPVPVLPHASIKQPAQRV